MEPNYLETLQGIAFYDARGLPKRLFTTQGQSIYWSEQTFHALGLQKLIAQYLDLPQFDYGTLTAKEYRVWLARRGDGYIACIQHHDAPNQGELIKWLQELSIQRIENDPRFQNL